MEDTQITSFSPSGTIITMNSFIDPSNTEKYLKLFYPVIAEFKKHPENLFTAISVNPKDPGHIRIQHGWTKDSAWFFETFVNREGLIKSLNAQTESMWLKPRLIEHFDRYVEE